MYDYLDDFICDITCEEYWSDWDDAGEYIDIPYGYSFGIPDASIDYAVSAYEYDWSDWDL